MSPAVVVDAVVAIARPKVPLQLRISAVLRLTVITESECVMVGGTR